jgi:hypothetical protein
MGKTVKSREKAGKAGKRRYGRYGSLLGIGEK